MKVWIKNIESFIKKYYISFLWREVTISIDKNTINIILLDDDFWIKLLDRFIFNKSFEYIKDIKFKEVSSKLVDILNAKFYIPTDIKLWKKEFSTSKKSIFITSLLNDKKSLSNEFIKIINSSEFIFTNDLNLFSDLLEEGLFDFNWEFFNMSGLLVDNNINFDITILYFGDLFAEKSNLDFLYNKFLDRSIYTYSADSNFINDYSLSVSNYGSLLFAWSYDEETYNSDEIILNFESFLEISSFFYDEKMIKSMISKYTYSISLVNYNVLDFFIKDISNSSFLKYSGYFINIIYRTNSGYFSLFQEIENIDYSILKDEDNISNISIFIFKNFENTDIFKKLNSYDSPKNLLYLSAPLSKTSEFRFDTIEYIRKSKYIFWESLEGIKWYFEGMNITYDDKKLFFWDDLTLLGEYKDKLWIENDITDLDIIPKVLPDLIKLIDNWEKIIFLSDWWAPCILDPGDYIKKFIIKNYSEYSILGIPGPNVLSTILLWVAFDYKKIFWTPLIYGLRPATNKIVENNFFNLSIYDDTLLIFYSFVSEIKNDILTLNKIFDSNIKMQIFADIWTEYEYNKVTTLWDFCIKYYKELLDISDNVVYVFKK